MFTRLPINTLSGGVGRQAPTKRLTSEAENIDNCLVSLEKSIEKRPPLVQVAYTKDGANIGTYLPVNHVTPPSTFLTGGVTNFNPDNLYFHYLDVDGNNRYCIVINRAAYTFDPTVAKNFTYTPQGGATITINLASLITVFRIEPTEWILEDVDVVAGATEGNTSGFNRGIFEYITFGNKNITTSYKIGNQNYTVPATSIKDTFGSVDLDVGLLLWNKLIPLDYLPDNSSLELTSTETWYSAQATNSFIHSGDTVNYKTSTSDNLLNPFFEDDITSTDFYWSNVRDNIDFYVNGGTLEEEERGQNVNDFSVIPQYPASEVQNDVNDANGFKAQRMLSQYYDKPKIIPIPQNSIDFGTDHYHQTSPLPPLVRDGQTVYGYGKIYQTRNSYLTFPSSIYRATRYGKNPYFERIRTEDANSVFDHRRFPLIIYKDTATDGKWRVKFMPLFPRRAGTRLSNPGPKALERKEKIQSMAFWKNRLWIATDSTLLASRTNSFFNFWVDDVQNITETDPIDIQSTVGAYNKLSFIVPFQSILFVASSGSVQFEVRGGSIDTGISPFNVEFRPTSFYSTSKLVEPQKMGNNIFFMDAGRLYMYLSGSAFNDEFSTSMDMSTHCKGYLPLEYGAVTTNSAVNSIMFVDDNQKNYIYFFTFRTNGEKVIQNAYYRWILSNRDNIQSIKAYEKDLYIVSKRSIDPQNTKGLVVFFASLETVSISTPMVDWLTTVPTANMLYSNGNNTTTVTMPHYDPEVAYVIKAPEWGTDAYTVIPIPVNGITTINENGTIKTRFVLTGNYTTYPIYVGHPYEMNIELSQQVQRSSDDQATVYEGVLNIKRATFRHYNTGSYDIIIDRRGRLDDKVTFYPTDINSLLTRNDQLKIDRVGEHLVKVLSYSEACKIFIKSSYPTPCNISNIDIVGNFRRFNTSIE